MTPRVFISYRTSDGADKATAPARELDALFGDAPSCSASAGPVYALS